MGRADSVTVEVTEDERERMHSSTDEREGDDEGRLDVMESLGATFVSDRETGGLTIVGSASGIRDIVRIKQQRVPTKEDMDAMDMAVLSSRAVLGRTRDEDEDKQEFVRTARNEFGEDRGEEIKDVELGIWQQTAGEPGKEPSEEYGESHVVPPIAVASDVLVTDTTGDVTPEEVGRSVPDEAAADAVFLGVGAVATIGADGVTVEGGAGREPTRDGVEAYGDVAQAGEQKEAGIGL